MIRNATRQLNVRSEFAHDRAAQLARQFGLTTKQVVEDALRAYEPPGERIAPEGMVWKGRILVKKATGRTITLEESLAAIEAARNERADDIS